MSNHYDILVRDVRRVRLPSGATEVCTVAVKDGKIADILPRECADVTADKTVDGAGKYIIPGMIDLHVHLRDPGFEYKEDIISGSRAAAAGGVTSVFAMPNTKPVPDNPETLAYIHEKAKGAHCRVFPLASITKNMESGELTDIPLLAKSGAYSFSDDGKPVMTSKLLYEAMKITAENDLLIMSHCEDVSLAKGGAINEGKVSRLLGLGGIPNLAEDVATERDIMIAEATGARLHVCHVSTRGSLELIRRAKARGVKVTCETCPHYFSLSENDVIYYGSNAKMNPPLRSADDVRAVIEAIIDGTVDAISTDHAPHSAEEKGADIAKALNGIIGVQTSFIVSYTNLVQRGHVSLARLIELMSVNPARITGLDKIGLGSIEVGSEADFALVTLGCENTVTKDLLRGKSTNTPFVGMTFGARVDATYLRGKCVYEA